MLVRLSLIEQIIKDANLMCISFSVKHPQTFRKSWMSLSNMSRTISNMYTFICGPLLFKWMGLFQSWLDCFSIGVWKFIQNINFFIFSRWRPFFAIFKCSNLQSHYTFFQVHQIASDIVPIFYNKPLLMYWTLKSLEQIIQIWIISSKDINLQYIYKVYCRE